jgi:acyl-CoA thioesterase-2
VPRYARRRGLFGGHVAALALRAAGSTLPDGDPAPVAHALHAQFLRQGTAEEPVELRVERVRDGRSFHSRSVEAVQSDRVLFAGSCSFHRPPPGPLPAYAVPAAPDAPDPDDPAPPPPPALRSMVFDWEAPFEIRWLGVPLDGGPFSPTTRFWARCRTPIGDDPLVRSAALVYLSDMRNGTATAGAVAGGDVRRIPGITSLDHSLWLHRDGRLDDWLLADIRPLANAAGRGLVLGTLHDRDGALLCTWAQELLAVVDPA